MAPRRDYIDELKGLGILLVVFGHFMEQYRMNYPFVSATFFCIYAFHMALFCACSGLVARFNPRKLVTQQLWLYFLGQSLMLVFRAVVLREDFAESGGVLAALLLPWRHMWYLYALIFWHLTLPLLCLLRDRLGLAGSCLGMALAVAAGAGRRADRLAVHACAGVRLLPVLCLWRAVPPPAGYAGRLCRTKPCCTAAACSRSGGRLRSRILSGCFCSETILDNSAELFHDVSYAGGDRPEYRIVFYLVGIATTAALTVAAFSSGRRLTGLGRRTLAIYLLHLPILALLVAAAVFLSRMRGDARGDCRRAVVHAARRRDALAVLNLAARCRLSCDVAANCWYKRGKS